MELFNKFDYATKFRFLSSLQKHIFFLLLTRLPVYVGWHVHSGPSMVCWHVPRPEQ